MAMDTKDRILIVDDDPEIRQLLVDYLVRQGFDAVPLVNVSNDVESTPSATKFDPLAEATRTTLPLSWNMPATDSST